jgi:hypothetical protein
VSEIKISFDVDCHVDLLPTTDDQSNIFINQCHRTSSVRRLVQKVHTTDDKSKNFDSVNTKPATAQAIKTRIQFPI